jgi:hypothetical protein
VSLQDPTAADLGRWRLLEVEYTAIFSDGLDPDPAVVRAIREFDPAYVPVLVRRVFKSPTGGVDAFGYHVIGRHITHWAPGEEAQQPVNLASTPVGWPYATGTVYAIRTWSLPWKKGSWQFRNGFPEIFLPHDMDLCRWMHAAHRQMFGVADGIKRQIKARMRAQAAEQEKEMEAAQARAKERLHDDKRELRDAVENELHWMEHPRQRPDDRPSPKGFVGPSIVPDLTSSPVEQPKETTP